VAQYSDLFVAAESDAQAVATADDAFERWHSVSLKDVLELEWMAFAKAARTDVFGEPLFLDESAGRVVCAMTEHVQAKLAAIADDDRRSLARDWRKHAENFAAWPDEAVDRALAGVCELARRARDEHKSVLYLASWG
jgi:hypothetical protein